MNRIRNGSFNSSPSNIKKKIILPLRKKAASTTCRPVAGYTLTSPKTSLKTLNEKPINSSALRKPKSVSRITGPRPRANSHTRINTTTQTTAANSVKTPRKPSTTTNGGNVSKQGSLFGFHNIEQLQRDYDQLKLENGILKQNSELLQLNMKQFTQEMSKLKEENTALKQSETLVLNDYEYFRREHLKLKQETGKLESEVDKYKTQYEQVKTKYDKVKLDLEEFKQENHLLQEENIELQNKYDKRKEKNALFQATNEELLNKYERCKQKNETLKEENEVLLLELEQLKGDVLEISDSIPTHIVMPKTFKFLKRSKSSRSMSLPSSPSASKVSSSESGDFHGSGFVISPQRRQLINQLLY